ncbi:Vps53 family protein [Besnoitia besnoiti]|uniref:Vps53 family protein n=1 Tax=Besnoitia besnoiti TaxID=94643 RepID=A0A2A9MC22_BESBE|nr:Vps53 family protein [Besnoitia besnoiti]PFH35419.1 Vps53 family protein [Besnoitia besnoiti]
MAAPPSSASPAPLSAAAPLLRPAPRPSSSAALASSAAAASPPLSSSPPSSEVLAVCIQQLNEEFPTLESLASLDAKIASLQAYLRALDKDILVAVREQARRSSSASFAPASAASAPVSLDAFRARVKALSSSFHAMRAKTEASDRKVAKICWDLQRLALAKKNLTLSISSLKRLVMLVTALDKLRVAGKNRKYAEAAQLLLAINNLVGTFEPYRDRVERIGLLLSEKELLCRSLQQQLIEDYQAVFEEDACTLPASAALFREPPRAAGVYTPAAEEKSSNPFAADLSTGAGGGGGGGAADRGGLLASLGASASPFAPNERSDALLFLDPAQREALKEAPLAVEVLGPAVVRDAVQLVCHSLLFNYNKLFRPNTAAIFGGDALDGRKSQADAQGAAGLEVIDRRFAWLKRTMREFEGKHESLFPARWRVKMHLATLFCRVTKQHFVDMLSCSQHTVDPILLIRLLHKTVEFELSLDAKFRHEESALEMMKDLENDRKSSLLDASSAAASLQYYDQVFPSAQNSSSSGSLNPFELDKSDAPPPGGPTGGRERERREEEEEKEEAFQLTCFHGLLSSVFDPFLFRWAEFEEQQLVDFFSAALVSDKLVLHAQYAPAIVASAFSEIDAEDEKRRRGRALELEQRDGGANADDVDDLLGEEEESDVCVFSSASEILSACKKLFDKAKAVSRGQAIKEIALVLQRLFKKYAGVLKNRLPASKQFASPPSLSDLAALFPSGASGESLAAPGASLSAASCSVSAASPFLLACATVGTSVYVEASLERLKENLSKALLEANAPDKNAISSRSSAEDLADGAGTEADEAQELKFEEVHDLLWTVQSSAISLLVASFNSAISSSLSYMLAEGSKKASAASREERESEARGCHANISSLQRQLERGMAVASLFLSATLCRFVWDKLAQAVVSKVHAQLAQIKQLAPAAAESLLRDVETLHAALLDLPASAYLGGEANGTEKLGKNRKKKFQMPAGYEKYVSREMERAEALLRVAAYPPEDEVATVSHGATSLFGRSHSSSAVPKVEKTTVLPIKESKLFSSSSFSSSAPSCASSSSPSSGSSAPSSSLATFHSSSSPLPSPFAASFSAAPPPVSASSPFAPQASKREEDSETSDAGREGVGSPDTNPFSAPFATSFSSSFSPALASVPLGGFDARRHSEKESDRKEERGTGGAMLPLHALGDTLREQGLKAAGDVKKLITGARL